MFGDAAAANAFAPADENGLALLAYAENAFAAAKLGLALAGDPARNGDDDDGLLLLAPNPLNPCP